MQTDLFPTFTRVRKGSSDTSWEAAESVSDRINDLHKKVLVSFEYAGARGLTDEELNGMFGHDGSTYRTRRSELTQLGQIVDSGERRKLRSGRKAIVWVLTKHQQGDAA